MQILVPCLQLGQVVQVLDRFFGGKLGHFEVKVIAKCSRMDPF